MQKARCSGSGPFFDSAARKTRRMQKEHLRDLLPDRIDRVKGGHRILEHHRCDAAAQRAPVLLCQIRGILPRKPNTPVLYHRMIGVQTERRPAQCSLAGAGFSD